jgi:hypothetical protein
MMGTTYYVSAADGNNNNPGTQIAQSLRTIQAAINKAQAGDTIYVRNGVYAERLYIQKAGAADAPIKLAAHQGEQPIIDGTALNVPADSGLVVIQQSQDIVLIGLTLRNAVGRGLAIGRSSRIIIQDCAVETCQAGGLQAVQTDSLLVERCRVRDCARHFLSHGPSRQNVALLVSASTNVTLRHNQVFENFDQGILVGPGCAQAVIQNNVCYDNRNGQIGLISSRDVVIDSNLCYHTGRAAFLDLRGHRGPGVATGDLREYRTDGVWHTRQVRITNNIVVGCGAGFQTQRGGVKLTDLRLAHNTILNSVDAGIQIATRERASRTYIENNLVAAAGGNNLTHVPWRTGGVVWRHNLWSAFPGERAHNPSNDVIEVEVGLVDLHAPVVAGALTADPYKLIEGSAAIDRGIRDGAAIDTDFWGAPRAGRPDLGANEFPNGGGEEEQIELPPDGVRVTAGLLCLYDFKEGQGRQVTDVGGVGEPLNLTIRDAAQVTWNAGGLLINQPAFISSERPAAKIINACRQSNEITLEAWITPANVTQDGPARIVSISASKTARNVTLGQGLYGRQATDLYVARLRTEQTSANGLPAVITPAGSATAALTHVVYTRDSAGRATIYIDGQERGVITVGGAFGAWEAQLPLLLANELSEDRPWLGQFRLVAIFGRALEPREVQHNYEAGQPVGETVKAAFTIPEGDEYGVAPHAVEFDAADSTADAGIAGYFWEFGDGQTSNRSSPVYTYTQPGIFSVSLTVTDAQRRTNKLTKERLVAVAASPIPPLPADYARFVLVNVNDSTVVAFGLQYPDLRCAIMWNDEPYHMMVYSEIDDVRRAHTGDTVQLAWVDQLEE